MGYKSVVRQYTFVKSALVEFVAGIHFPHNITLLSRQQDGKSRNVPGLLYIAGDVGREV